MKIESFEIKSSEEVVKIALALPEWFTVNGIELIKKDILFQSGLLATKDEQTIGFLTFFVNQGEATIGWMGVLPKFHKNGIGTALIGELKNLLLMNDIHTVLVSTLGDSVDYEPYAKTRAFYRKNGFNDHKIIPHLDNPEQEEELVLSLSF